MNEILQRTRSTLAPVRDYRNVVPGLLRSGVEAVPEREFKLLRKCTEASHQDNGWPKMQKP